MTSAPQENDAIAMSFAQQRMWFGEQYEPATAMYNLPIAWRIRGPLVQAALAQSLGEIVRRHEVLRACFPAVDGHPAVVVAAPAGVPLPCHDVSAVDDPVAAASSAAAAEADRPFDVAQGPLYRALLVRLGADDHLLVLTFHHLVCDGWSMGVLTRELSALYAAFVAGQPSPLPALAAQYRDFAQAQAVQSTDGTFAAQLAHWKRYLAGASARLDLRTDRPRPARASRRGGRVPFALSSEQSAGLRRLSRQLRATLFMTASAVFNVLLHGETGKRSLCIGYPVANRSVEALEDLIGLFVNTLVLRSEITPQTTFASLVRDVRDGVFEADAHQDVPFDQVVRALAPERRAERSPLFEVMLALENPGDSDLVLAGTSVEGFDIAARAAKFDLTMILRDEGAAIRGALEYDVDLFDAPRIEHMVAGFGALVTAVVADPSAHVHDLPGCAGSARGVPVEAAAPVEAAFAHEAIAAAARREPDGCAVEMGGERLSFGALDQRANHLAHVLRAKGVGPDALVAIFAERSPEMVIAMLAVLKAGGAYVPLDPSYPAERLRYVFADAGVKVVLTQGHLVERLPAAAPALLLLEEVAAGTRAEAPAAGVVAQNLAYVIYTSGSTGRPKGAMIHHGGLANYLAWAAAAYGLNAPGTRGAPVQSSVGFDLTVTSLLAPLAAGKSVVLLPQADEIEGLGELLCTTPEPFALVKITPAHLEILRQQIPVERLPHAARALVIGGEILRAETLEHWRTHAPAVRLINEYGPTETVVGSATYEVPADAVVEGVLPAGQAIAGTTQYVLDGDMRLLGVGETGELYIGGAGVCRGYLDRPELTAEKFLPDPFARIPGSRLYRSGDVARLLPDGNVEVLGRTDAQVKIRGYRIELGEIEAALGRLAGVREVVVLAREDAPGEVRLVAYAVGEGSLDPAELTRELRETLPPYMVPTAIVVLPALPLTVNGKIDRQALPAPAREARGPIDAPANPVEETIAGIWAHVLRLPRVGRQENFFRIGGHSLLASQVVSRVGSSLRVKVPLRWLFETPLLCEFAARVEAARRQDAPSAAPALPPLVRCREEGPAPLSFAQQRLWFMDQLAPGTSLYNVARAFRARGPLDEAALLAAFRALLERHEVLRARFPVVEGEVRQIVAPVAAVPLEVIDRAELAGEAREAEASRCVQRWSEQPFDLAEGPLTRVQVVRFAADDHLIGLSMHHIVCDGWSQGILEAELGELYRAFAGGVASPLRPLRLQYADYARWQRRTLPVLAESQLAYWKRQLNGPLPTLALPTDRPRPNEQRFEGHHIEINLPPALASTVRQLARAEGVTSYMALLAVFVTVLHRYSGQEDIIVGSPIAGRNHADLDGLVGFFVNSLPLRTRPTARQSFRAFLQHVRERALDAYDHQDLPFEQLVDALGLERDRSRSPLFQAMFAVESSVRAPLTVPGVSLEPRFADGASSKFDLGLTFWDDGTSFEGWIEYRTDLFDEGTIRRFLDHFVTLADAATRSPDTALGDLPLLTAGEDEALRVAGRATRGEPSYASDSLALRFERQVADSPDAIAVSCEDRSLTYAALNRAANRLAHALRARGVGRDARVGVCLERSLELPLVLLAVLKAGGAYVPLDPSHPAERRRYIVADAGLALVVTSRALAAEVAALGVEVVLVDDVPVTNAAACDENPPAGSAGQDLAYVIYTSGSTGRPKGSLITQANVLRLFDATAADFRFDGRDVFTLFHSFGFDFSVWELWGALLYGGRLVVVPYWVSRSPEAFYQLLCREGVTVLSQTPSAFAQLSQWEGQLAAPGELRLRSVVFGGEALDIASLRPWFERHGDSHPQLVNMYGITETTVHVTYRPLSWADLAGAAPSVIGPAIRDLDLYVLDPELGLVPAGVPGELCVGGPGLARGYLDRPELTAERFVPHPFAQTPGARLYRSGDLARVRVGADGQPADIEYLGRRDHQVKIRGFRIELGEIEAELGRHPGVEQPLVLFRREGGDAGSLCAYYRPAQAGTPVDPVVLRAHLGRRLPDYMLPAAFVAVDAFPLTENGKVDRARLPAPAQVDRAGAGDGREPQTPTELIVAGFFRELLHLEHVGANDDFFQLGGHSLLATQVVSRLRAAFDVRLPLGRFFAGATVAKLAAAVEAERRGQAGDGTSLPVCAQPDEVAVPLSAAQERLWFFANLLPDSPLYNVPLALRLRGPLVPERLAAAVSQLVQRHTVLRSTCVETDGQVVQQVQPARPLALDVVALDQVPVEDRQALLREHLTRAMAAPFDLRRDPCLRGELLRLGPSEHVLVLVLHHIACDGWSLEQLVRELSALYHAEAGAVLAAPSLQYRDFAAWQNAWLRSPACAQQLGYWQERLRGPLPVLELPADRSRPPRPTFAGHRLAFELSPAQVEALDRVGRREGTTRFMTLLTAFMAFLHRQTGATDLLVGCPVAGRNQAELEGIIGNFVNTVVVRAELGGGLTGGEALAQVRAAALGAYDNQDVPFDAVVAAVAPQRDLRASPVFQVAFGLQAGAGAPQRLGDLAVERVDAPIEGAKFDLALSMFEAGAEISGIFEYSCDLFDLPTVERLRDRFLCVLEGLLADPTQALEALPLLPAAERTRILALAQGPLQPVTESNFAAMVSAVAARLPDAVALVTPTQTRSYAALEARANQLAHALRAAGVGRESRVGVALDGSAELPLAMLAIWKAGGVYVPLDLRYPSERIRYVIEDAHIELCLTSAALAERVPTAVPRWSLAWDDVTLDGQPSTPPRGSSADAAYLIYTSGSTGQPKGVVACHLPLVNLAVSHHELLALGPGDRILQFASPSFDASIVDVAMALGSGAALHLAPRDTMLVGPDLLEKVRRERITVLGVPPSVLSALPDALLPDLRVIIAGGEACSADLVVRWAPGRRFLNAYGPTEATVCATTDDCVAAKETGASVAKPTIGRPLDNCAVYVLDQRGELSPIGVPGELYIGGVGVARGYLGRPELTASRFVPDPFSAHAGARLYRTGDLVRVLTDGRLDFLGRIDRQVKVRGFRIEPGEIEGRLRGHAAIAEAAVVQGRGADADKLLAYLVPRPGATVEVDAIRAHVRATLPEHMVPSAYVTMARLPLNGSGKLDTSALPDFQQTAAPPARPEAVPRGELEVAIARIWAEVLGRADIGVDHNFFDIGGTSLRMIRVHTRLQAELAAEVTLLELFQHPTVRRLAARLGEGRAAAPSLDAAHQRAARRRQGLGGHDRRSPAR